MTEHRELNYTGSTYMSSLFDRILGKDALNEDEVSHLLFIIKHKKKKIDKQRECFWGITKSDRLFYEYMDKLEQILKLGVTREAVTDLKEQAASQSREKIHILILTQEVSCWPTLESLYSAAVEDDRYNIKLVYTPFKHADSGNENDFFNIYKNEMLLPVIDHNNYDLAADSPDIVIMNKPYYGVPVEYHIVNLKDVVPRVIYIPYGMETTVDLAWTGFQYYAQYKAWKHIAYGDAVKDFGIRYGYRNGENIAVWGHPKADSYIDFDKKHDLIPEEWKTKIRDRKTILWTPHHIVDLHEKGTGTWLIWKDRMLDIIKRHKERNRGK